MKKYKDNTNEEMGFKPIRLWEDTHYKIRIAAAKENCNLLEFGDKLINLWNNEQKKLNK